MYFAVHVFSYLNVTSQYVMQFALLFNLQHLATERFRHLDYRMQNNPDDTTIAVYHFLAEMEQIRVFVNEGFANALFVLGTLKPMKIRKNWSNNWEL